MNFRKFTPHLIAIVAMLVLAAIFFSPNAFQGKVLLQPDNNKARAMQTEIRDYLKKDGKIPLWTNSAFGGMPSYQILAPAEGNFTEPVYRTLFLWTDINTVWAQVFTAMLCMYLFLVVIPLDWRISLFGAVAYGITTYNIDLLEAGHSTKMVALALTPGIFAGIQLLFRQKWLLGGGLMAMFMAMQLFANHVQITYYTLMLVGIWYVAQFGQAVLEKSVKSWAIAAAIGIAAVGIGFASNAARLWPTLEYSKETIRGKSELAQKAEQGGGLSKDYLFGWSYGVAESLTLLVPHYAGGGAGERYNNTKLYKAVQPQARNQIGALYYNGDQPFVGTSIYFGIIVCMLFLVGALLATGALRWWLLIGGVFMLTLAWGKNFFLNGILYDYLPMFNKFRAVSMALGPAQWCFAALAAVGLQKLTDSGIDISRRKRAVLIAGGVTVALSLLAWMTGGGEGQNDSMLSEQNPQLYSLLMEDRADMLRSDVLRALFLSVLSFGLLWLYLRGTIKAAVMVPLVLILSLGDQWQVCSRTISSDKYEDKHRATARPQPETFDQQILQDKDPDYRVLDLARGNVTTNYMPSFFHKSLSGYHAAKMQRYQEVIDTFLTKDIASNLHIVGMLNGKYIIGAKGDVVRNPMALGNAWFVKHITEVPTAEAEIGALHRLNPKDSAVVQSGFADAIKGFQPQFDSTASIRLSKYHPDHMEYEYSANSDQVAVFSEIYYPPSKGWKCYLNGQPAPDFFKVNYLLRGMKLPAGQNQKLEMKFEPRSFYTGAKIAAGASAIALLLFFAGLFLFFKKQELGESALLGDVETEEKTHEHRHEHKQDKGHGKHPHKKGKR